MFPSSLNDAKMSVLVYSLFSQLFNLNELTEHRRLRKFLINMTSKQLSKLSEIKIPQESSGDGKHIQFQLLTCLHGSHRYIIR